MSLEFEMSSTFFLLKVLYFFQQSLFYTILYH